jgi:hypothetical protein
MHFPARSRIISSRFPYFQISGWTHSTSPYERHAGKQNGNPENSVRDHNDHRYVLFICVTRQEHSHLPVRVIHYVQTRTTTSQIGTTIRSRPPNQSAAWKPSMRCTNRSAVRVYGAPGPTDTWPRGRRSSSPDFATPRTAGRAGTEPDA